MKATGAEVQGLIKAGIVEFRGVSGAKADLDIATAAPSLVRMHAMSGRVYTIAAWDVDRDEFTFEEVR